MFSFTFSNVEKNVHGDLVYHRPTAWKSSVLPTNGGDLPISSGQRFKKIIVHPVGNLVVLETSYKTYRFDLRKVRLDPMRV